MVDALSRLAKAANTASGCARLHKGAGDAFSRAMTNLTPPLKAGVVGAGVFGGYHASKYAADPRTRLVGVFDPVSDHARSVCETHGGEAFASLDALIEAADVLTVASPAVFHHDAARRALRAGKPVLVEKPISATVQEGRELVALAAENSLVLQIGHQERFVFKAMGLLGAAPAELPPLSALSARRMGVPSARNLDVSVTLDLMIHDLDLVLALAGAAPVRVEAELVAERARLADHVRCRLTFEDGLVAELESSRVAEARDRVMALSFEGGAALMVDFIHKRFENGSALPLNPDFAEAAEAKDSLGANVSAFLDAVTGAPGGVAATGAAGLLALETALAIDEAAGGRSRL